MAEDTVTWAEINDRLAELDGECRHRWDDWDHESLSHWVCSKCGDTCCDQARRDEARRGACQGYPLNRCCGWLEEWLPTVGDGDYDYTLEQMLGLSLNLKLNTVLTGPNFDPGILHMYSAFIFPNDDDGRVAFTHGDDPRIALGTAIIRAMEGE